jgi:hypothetical protein
MVDKSTAPRSTPVEAGISCQNRKHRRLINSGCPPSEQARPMLASREVEFRSRRDRGLRLGLPVGHPHLNEVPDPDRNAQWSPAAVGDAKNSSFGRKGNAGERAATGRPSNHWTPGPRIGPECHPRAIVPPRKFANPGAARDHITSPLTRPRASGHRDIGTPIKPADRLGCLRKAKLCREP